MKLCLLYRLPLFLILFAREQAHAQFSRSYNFKFKNYTVKDGLVHNFTKKCITDRKGFLWIITQHGLSRFDGLEFKNFEHSNSDSLSLPANDLEDIAVDKNNRIWLSYKTGLCCYDQSSRRFRQIMYGRRPFTCLAFSYDSTRDCLWTADYERYYRLDCKSFLITATPLQKPTGTHLGIEQLFLDSKDRLWILLDRRGYFTIGIKSNVQFYYDEDIWPMHVYEDEDHRFWMSTWASGFRKINFNGQKHEHTLYPDPYNSPNDPFGQIYYGISEAPALTGKDILWITKSTQGLLFFDKKQEKFVHNFQYDPNIKNGIATDFNNLSYTDPQGILWICTWHGLTKINSREQQFTSRELPFLQTTYYNRLSGLQDDPGDKNILWIGVEGSGIIRYDKTNNRVLSRYFNVFADPGLVLDSMNYNWRWIESMFIDSKKTIWATTYGGLIKIKNGTVQKILLAGKDTVYPRTMVEDKDNTLWIAAETGLFSYKPADGKTRKFLPQGPAKNNYLQEIIKEDSAHLLMAGKSGAYEFSTETGNFRKMQWQLKDIDSMGQQECYAIQLIHGIAYIGTKAGLIAYNMNTNSAVQIGQIHGIDKVYDNRLKKDANDNLWIFTSHGLFEYNTHTQAFREYNTGDGIYDFNEDKIGFFGYGDLFYIGYRMAMTSFDPLSVNVNSASSIPLITDISINNLPLSADIDSLTARGLELPYRDNNIKVSFTAADFTNSGKITFAYMLSGYDKDWIYSGTIRTATYANLAGGGYIFRVKACNSSGVWNDRAVSVRINIATPFWQTIWFYLLLALFAFLVIYLLYRRRLRRLVELYKIRDTISKNLHDEIGATLSSINIYSDVARKKNIPGEETNLLMERIHKASGRVMESMNDIVWYVNPKNDSWDNIILRMREYAIPFLEAKNIHPDFQLDESVLRYKLNMQQRQQVYFIFKEAINNVVKYADAATVRVRLEKKDKNIFLVIIDDGKGFDQQAVRMGNGLWNMDQRAQMVKGILDITSRPGMGTAISLRIPIT